MPCRLAPTTTERMQLRTVKFNRSRQFTDNCGLPAQRRVARSTTVPANVQNRTAEATRDAVSELRYEQADAIDLDWGLLHECSGFEAHDRIAIRTLALLRGGLRRTVVQPRGHGRRQRRAERRRKCQWHRWRGRGGFERGRCERGPWWGGVRWHRWRWRHRGQRRHGGWARQWRH
jgi:hypothetical protein